VLFSPGVKLPGREADHSPSTTAEVKNTWAYTATPHGVVLNLLSTGTTLFLLLRLSRKYVNVNGEQENNCDWLIGNTWPRSVLK
jgi:hypothetical protein